jgi:hypothetical protein
VKLPVLEALRRYPRNLLIGVGAHVADTAAVYLYATFTVSYATGTLGIARGTVLTGVIVFGIVVIALQPVYGALSDRIGRRPLNIFSVVFTAAFAYVAGGHLPHRPVPGVPRGVRRRAGDEGHRHRRRGAGRIVMSPRPTTEPPGRAA